MKHTAAPTSACGSTDRNAPRPQSHRQTRCDNHNGGRALTIPEESKLSDAVLYVFHPGTMGGPAIANLLSGKVNPSGRLPLTMPRMTGQLPLYYAHNNTDVPRQELYLSTRWNLRLTRLRQAAQASISMPATVPIPLRPRPELHDFQIWSRGAFRH